MKIWFIRRNSESLGPYTIEELKNLPVAKDDYVWKKGLPDWVQAKAIPELKPLFQYAPPPFVSKNDRNSSVNQNNSRRRLLWIGIMLILCLLTFLIYANNHPAYIPFATDQRSSELLQTEKQNPISYISEKTSHRQNLIDQTVLEGTLTNSATLAVFKDVELQVNFLSKTNTIITTQKFSVYEIINPGQTIHFKKKIFVSKDVANVNVTIANATPVN